MMRQRWSCIFETAITVHTRYTHTRALLPGLVSVAKYGLFRLRRRAGRVSETFTQHDSRGGSDVFC